MNNICSESFCNIHDVGMVISDEEGQRPRGRNPWRGFCLRIKAMDDLAEIKQQTYDYDLRRTLDTLTDVVAHLAENAPQPSPRPQRKPTPPLPTDKQQQAGGYKWTS